MRWSYTVDRRLNVSGSFRSRSETHWKAAPMSHDLLDSAALSLHLEMYVPSQHEDHLLGTRA
jgi:hypothetical protein